MRGYGRDRVESAQRMTYCKKMGRACDHVTRAAMLSEHIIDAAAQFTVKGHEQMPGPHIIAP
jgi:hypothetical protein